MSDLTPDQQLEQLRGLKIEFLACLSAAGRMLDPSAMDLRPQDIAAASGMLDQAEARLAEMMARVNARLADERERERQRRRSTLVGASGAYDVMAAAKIGGPA